MNRLWRRSVRHIKRGVVTEYGATIVWQRGRLRLVNIVEGTSDDVTLVLTLRSGQRYVGFFHTHPYEEGDTGIAFSGADFAVAFDTDAAIAVVQSGDYLFALVRTEQTPSTVDLAAVEEEGDELIEQFINDDLPFDEAVLRASLELCARYGWALYAGTSDGVLEVLLRP